MMAFQASSAIECFDGGNSRAAAAGRAALLLGCPYLSLS
jgi:hypothetical protein